MGAGCELCTLAMLLISTPKTHVSSDTQEAEKHEKCLLHTRWRDRKSLKTSAMDSSSDLQMTDQSCMILMLVTLLRRIHEQQRPIPNVFFRKHARSDNDEASENDENDDNDENDGDSLSDEDQATLERDRRLIIESANRSERKPDCQPSGRQQELLQCINNFLLSTVVPHDYTTWNPLQALLSAKKQPGKFKALKKKLTSYAEFNQCTTLLTALGQQNMARNLLKVAYSLTKEWCDTFNPKILMYHLMSAGNALEEVDLSNSEVKEMLKSLTAERTQKNSTAGGQDVAPIYQQEDRALMQTNLAKQLIYQKRFLAFRKMGEHCALAGNVSLDDVSLGCDFKLETAAKDWHEDTIDVSVNGKLIEFAKKVD